MSGRAKLAIWKTRKNRVRGAGSEDVVMMLNGPLAARLRVEFGFYRLTKKTEVFVNIWCVKNVLCSVREELRFVWFCFDVILFDNSKT